MSAFAAEVLKPISADHGAAVLALHHLGKPGPSRAASDLGHRVRGASDILAFVDSLWTLDRDSEGTTTLRNAIGRWDETAEPLKVMMEDLEDGEAIRLVGEPSRRPPGTPCAMPFLSPSAWSLAPGNRRRPEADRPEERRPPGDPLLGSSTARAEPPP